MSDSGPTEMLHPPWPWRFDPGGIFNAIGSHARVAAGFPIRRHGVEDREYDAEPKLLARDVALVLVVAIRRARRSAVELDFDELIALARAEVERWEEERRTAAPQVDPAAEAEA